MGNKIIIISTIVVFTFGYAIYHALKLDNKLASNADYFSSNSVLKTLPEAKLSRYFSGQEIDLKKLASKGNFIVVHFWATWCGPCEQEFPEIVELTDRLKNKSDMKFFFVAVNDKDKDVKKFLSGQNMDDNANYIIARDDTFIHQKFYGTYKLPETFIFGKDGQLIRKFTGAQKWTDPAFIKMLSDM